MKSPTLTNLLLLAFAGALGTLARYFTYALCARSPWAGLPLGTLTVNVLGSFAFAVVFVLAEQHARLNPVSKWLLLTGFMGAFTTFSTFAFETSQYLMARDYLAASINLLANNILGIGAFMLGWWLTSSLVRSA